MKLSHGFGTGTLMMFFIWTHGEESLSSFVEYINSYHQTIKFTTEKSRDSVSYLDVLVSRKGQGLGDRSLLANLLMHTSICRGALVIYGTSKKQYIYIYIYI